jgi:hypothetical protein
MNLTQLGSMNMLVRQTEIGIEMNIYDTDFLGEKDYRA